MTRTTSTDPIPTWLRAALAVVASLVCAAALGITTATSASAASVPDPKLSGAYPGSGDVEDAAALAAMRGGNLEIVSEYVDSANWDTLTDPSWQANRWKNTDYRVAWGIGIIPKSGGSLEAGARGEYNKHFRKLAQNLVASDMGDSILRLGWEMNGTWFPWSAVGKPKAFVGYWRNIVDTMRAVPGANFMFEWSTTAGQGASGFDKTQAYPGDDYVDMIGLSAYDQSWQYSPGQREERWDELVNQKFGMQWAVDFAAARGKPNSLSEWALSDRCDGRGGGDNPYYIEKMAEWIASHPYYYESYFDHKTYNCEQHSITEGNFPKARAVYNKLFPGPQADGQDAAPVAGPSGADLASTLKISWSSTRSRSRELAWVGVDSDVYIFAQPPAGTTKVRFYVDDESRSRTPVQVEDEAPWDLEGGTRGRANAFDASRLSRGEHVLTAVYETSDGEMVANVRFLR